MLAEDLRMHWLNYKRRTLSKRVPKQKNRYATFKMLLLACLIV